MILSTPGVEQLPTPGLILDKHPPIHYYHPMPYRRTVLANDEIYHVFNRGVARLPIFSSNKNYLRFLDLIDYYRFKNTPISFSHLQKLTKEEREKIMDYLSNEEKTQVEILAFCLMENHFHFLLKQKLENGISKFISNLQNGYAKYFNIKTDRTGPLFQPMFKSVRVITDEQLLHVSRYIHLNPSTGFLVEIADLENFPWSSLSRYIPEGDSSYSFVDTTVVLGLMGNQGKSKYKEFVFNQAEYQKELGKIKHLILE